MPWNSNKRLGLKIENGTYMMSGYICAGFGQPDHRSVASLRMAFPDQGVVAYLTRAEEDGPFEIRTRDGGAWRTETCADSLGQSWLSMLASAARVEDGETRRILEMLLPIARAQLDAAATVLARDDVEMRRNGVAVQTVCRLPAGFSVIRHPFVETDAFRDGPPKLLRHGKRITQIEIGADGLYGVEDRYAHPRAQVFPTPAGAFRSLLSVALEAEDLSAHNRLALRDAIEELDERVTRAGGFAEAFGLEALMNPVTLLNARLREETAA
jgi:hypothetical protein